MSEIQLKDWLPPGVPVAIKGILLRSYNLNDPDDLALLDQDILEIELSNGMRIDVGWFPENDHNGRFVIRVFRKPWQSWTGTILLPASVWSSIRSATGRPPFMRVTAYFMLRRTQRRPASNLSLCRRSCVLPKRV